MVEVLSFFSSVCAPVHVLEVVDADEQQKKKRNLPFEHKCTKKINCRLQLCISFFFLFFSQMNLFFVSNLLISMWRYVETFFRYLKSHLHLRIGTFCSISGGPRLHTNPSGGTILFVYLLFHFQPIIALSRLTLVQKKCSWTNHEKKNCHFWEWVSETISIAWCFMCAAVNHNPRPLVTIEIGIRRLTQTPSQWKWFRSFAHLWSWIGFVNTS